MTTRFCRDCGEVYHETVSCPKCGHVPEHNRADYESPELCDPWRAELEFPDASIKMTVLDSQQRRLVHEMVRHFGGGQKNDC